MHEAQRTESLCVGLSPAIEFDQWLAGKGIERSGTLGAEGTSYGLPQGTDVKATIQSFQEYLTRRPPPTR